MAVSLVDIQRDILLDTVRRTGRDDWKVLVLDETSKKLIDNVVKEDDILNENVTNIEMIEQRRPMNQDTDAVYILSPQPHVVDCLMADFERRRYKKTFLIWTALLDPRMRRRLDTTPSAREQIAGFRVLSVDYFPRESHLVTFRDPWSFPILYHPACNGMVKDHLQALAQKIVSVCVSLGEYPVIRYYRPRNPGHEASVLCSHLARFAQDDLDEYAQYHPDFPPQVNRPRGALFITDRSMDLMSPLVHEFTYQAMAHDLLPIRENEKVLYKTVINEGEPNEEIKDMEIGERDRIWVENRHRHMKDTIEKLMGDFQKFIDDNPHFSNRQVCTNGNATSLNAIKDMLAGLPQFQELKEAYSLHLSMAQECMNIFQHRKLPDLASVEQSLATGLDEDYRKPKNLADQVVRLLDDESVNSADRLRVIILYLLYRDGLLPADTQKLLAHAQLPPQDNEVIANLDLLGARVAKSLKDKREPPLPLFSKKQRPVGNVEEYALSRYDPAVKSMLEEHMTGMLDQAVFPFTKPQLDAPANGVMGADNVSQASLRSAKPTWAKSRLASVEPRQRIIVFVAGGATYAEARACYEVSRSTSRDVVLVTSHMMTPGLFLRQVGDLGVDPRRLDLPADRPKPKAPAHLFEPEPKPRPPPAAPTTSMAPPPMRAGSGPAPTIAALHSMSLDPRAGANGGPPGSPSVPPPPGPSAQSSKRDKEREKEEKEKKKKHHFFGKKKEK
ncbi:MAG: vacuolar sorting protein VPS33/slp1 [Thelocarpon impressellum]|nr:MAG: vacuolar sorting protein VPS33/slp1 [Thelocarpon impressellum]